MSSQNLTFLPLPTFHKIPIWVAFKAQVTPFQKGDRWVPKEQQILGFSVLYLQSIILVQIELVLRPYLKIQEIKSDKFRFFSLEFLNHLALSSGQLTANERGDICASPHCYSIGTKPYENLLHQSPI